MNVVRLHKISVIVLFLFLLEPSVALAQQTSDPQSVTPQVYVNFGNREIEFPPIGPCDPEGGSEQCIGWIGQYIGAIYSYGVGLAAILAVVMIMVGGFIWLTSAGSSPRVGSAKEFIAAALSGLAIALFSFIILQTINPRLTSLEPLEVRSIEQEELEARLGDPLAGCCKVRVTGPNYDNTTCQQVADIEDDCSTNSTGTGRGSAVSTPYPGQLCIDVQGCPQYQSSPPSSQAGCCIRTISGYGGTGTTCNYQDNLSDCQGTVGGSGAYTTLTPRPGIICEAIQACPQYDSDLLPVNEPIPPELIPDEVGGLVMSGAFNRDLQRTFPSTGGIETLHQAVQDEDGRLFVGGLVSTFGGPQDSGIQPDETGAITGELLWDINPDDDFYVAFRFDYSRTPLSSLRNRYAQVYNPETGRYVNARIVDWGPNPSTGKSLDTSNAVLRALGAQDGVSNLYIRLVPRGGEPGPVNP